MRKSTVAVSVVMFSAPFIVLASRYHSLPAQLPLFRNPLAGVVAVGSKSLFTVFRVPLMNLTHGLMAAVLLAHTSDFPQGERRTSYAAFFLTLLLAVAFKSNFEAIEISQLVLPFGLSGRWAATGTMASVVGGLVLAFIRGRKARLPWSELKLLLHEKIILAGLLALYLAVVAASFAVAR